MVFRRIIFLMLFILILSYAWSNDSLHNLETEMEGSVGKKKIDLLNSLSEEYRILKSDKSLEFAYQALELAEKLKYRKGRAQAYHQLAYYKRHIKDYELSLDYYLKAIELWLELKLQKELANEQSNVAYIYIKTGEFKQAQIFYQQSLDNSIAQDDSISVALAYNNLGTVSSRRGNYSEALDFLYKSLQIKEELFRLNPLGENCFKRDSSLNNIGNIHLRMGNYDKALEAYHKVLEINDNFTNKKQKVNTINNIGIVYQQLEDFQKSLIYFQQALTINQELNDRKRIAAIMNNIGLVHEKMNDFNVALDYYKLALEIKTEIGDKFGIANVKKNVGSIYLIFKDYDKAADYFEQSLKLSREIGARDIIKDNFRFLAEMYAGRNDFATAYQYELKHIALKDSIYNESTSFKLAELETKYELEKSEKEKELLVKDNLIYKLNMEKANLAKMRSYMIVTLLLLFVSLLLYRAKQKQKINKVLQRSKQDLEIKVIARTSELAQINVELEKEIVERKKVEEKITESLNEKEILLREVHHRVKNNLQVISSILNLQAREGLDEQAYKMFKNTQDRVYSMSLIHEKLYIEDNLAKIDIRNYISGLINYLMGTYQINTRKIKIKLDIGDILFNVGTAVPCGLIINEIITNSIKYAFPEDKTGTIFVNMYKNKDTQITLTVGDDGVSFPQDFDQDKSDSIGLKLINLLSKQLRAKNEFKRDRGVVYKFIFKEINK